MNARWLCLLLVWTGSACAAADLPGRLFFTPQERQKLERGELLNPPAEGVAPPLAASAPVARPAPAGYRVDGVVRRSSGRDTVWLNGQPLPPGQGNAAGVVVEPAPASPKVVVRLPNGRRIEGRIGETLPGAP